MADDDVGEEPETAGIVRQLLDSAAYRQSASDRQAELLDAIRRLHVEIETRQRDLFRLVEEAQRQGVSWSKIGQAQGVSAQAAQQRAKRRQAVGSHKSTQKR
ncbi:hypothetical protein [Mycolicibacterium wolinskyi]|uniref:hypothetical protein n=1 Tax=Mycolicibacterium wolinskyi TaxID=59750 RepID=UPI003BAAE6BB